MLKVSSRDTYKCVKHDNFDDMVKKLNRLKILEKNNAEDVSSMVCCPIATMQCMYRTCKNCCDKKIIFHVTDDTIKSDETFFYKWHYNTENRNIKGKEKKVKILDRERIKCALQ